MTKRGFLFAELDITDPKIFYEEYMTLVAPVLEKFGARFLVSTNDPEVIEGGRNVRRVILLEFDTPQIARDFYHSSDYQDVIGYRLKSASTHLYIFDGLPSNEN